MSDIILISLLLKVSTLPLSITRMEESVSDITDSGSHEVSTDPCVESLWEKFKPVVSNTIFVYCQEVSAVVVVETFKGFPFDHRENLAAKGS